MFEELLEMVEKKLKESGSKADYEDIIDFASKVLIEDTLSHEKGTVGKVISENDAFIKRNREKWSLGFQKLHALRETSLQAGMNFQKQFLEYDHYQTDELIGVLMRQHAHACRISGEIIHLLEGGYPDAAVARWRTLYEMVITCLLIKKYGRNAAIDYIKYGIVKNAEGINEHKRTAAEMGVETFSQEEIDFANSQKEEITEGKSSWHWARKYAGVSKVEKLREHVGLDKWSHNYKLASRNIHSDYFEMSCLYAMSEAKSDMLLVGQSNSGLIEPAHFTAISLAQITSIFLTAYIEDKSKELDYQDSLLFMKVIDNYVKEVGEAFLNVEKAI
ncbi:hypothetical protein CWB96_17880 [Pseudoalteromonas citrea]|uniref:Uncharacterized protein n=1 Tax=Pseudoalteromonas citrea TaxID=43655 RepID=A0A5S3XK80_9GAMM|nr:DUF5677 domain-containing protein [Pseudoalteromonas citrea]TMP41300.1 hypothetical protein CWB97_15120 [Pseudoalteromonas citrea]TMP55110.1 hypothetical protein CWB96_17880 [Pseudoalteromonas citrea]